MSAPPRPAARRASTKGVRKFNGDALVDGVVHKASGRTFATQAELEAFEADTEAVEAAIEENQKRIAALALEEQAAHAAAEARRTEIEENERLVAVQKAESAAKRAEAQAQAETEARAAEARAAEARAAEARAAEARAAEARAAEAEEAEAEVLKERIAQEKARREKLRKEEAEASAAAAKEERLAAERDAEMKAEATRAALAAASEQDSAELREKQRRAEERRRKQAAFLAETNDFGAAFEVHNAKVQSQKTEQIGQTQNILAKNLANQAEGFVGVDSKYKPEEYARQAPRQPTFVEPAAKSIPAPELQDEISEEAVIKLSGGHSDTFEATSSALFSSATRAAASASVVQSDDAPLRKPSSLGSGVSKKGESRAPLVGASKVALQPSVPVARIGQERKETPVPKLSAGAPAKQGQAKEANTSPSVLYEPDDLSNMLTPEERMTLTAEEKVVWRAKQEDMGRRRKGFHGAVTYAFDGIFSWQMYGSAEAVDDSGAVYTEYLMRCQWGTSWDNLQPWISARRYREFDTLDYDLRRAFPNYERSMPTLPAKDFFRALETDVIVKRRQALESYMSRVVLTLPALLRSRIFSEFLGIQERLLIIKKQLFSGIKQTIEWKKDAEVSFLDKSDRNQASHKGALSPYEPDEKARNETDRAFKVPPKTTDNDLPAPQAPSVPLDLAPPAAPAAEVMDIHANAEANIDESKFIRTVEKAEEKRLGGVYCPPLTEDQLSYFEDELGKLIIGLQAHTGNRKIKKSSEGYRKLIKITTAWPKLRATCQLEESVAIESPTLIPRALQAEEDLVKLIRDFDDAMSTSNHLASLGI